MKRLIFTLSMPRTNSWNGKWSGEGRVYTIAKRVPDKVAKTLADYYTYAFGDGWCAGVSVREAKPREKATNKFCGYEWMVKSILQKGMIAYDTRF